MHKFDQFTLAKLKNSGQDISGHLICSTAAYNRRCCFSYIWHHIRFLKIGTEITAWLRRPPEEAPVLRQPRGNGDPNDRPSTHTSRFTTLHSHTSSGSLLPPCLLGIVPSYPGFTRSALYRCEGNPGSPCPLSPFTSLAPFQPRLGGISAPMHTPRGICHIYSIPVAVPVAPQLPPLVEHLAFNQCTSSGTRSVLFSMLFRSYLNCYHHIR